MDITTLVDELERVLPKMTKISEMEIERKLAEDNQTSVWFYRKLTDLGEMSLAKLQELCKINKVIKAMPLDSISEEDADRWHIEITDNMVYAKLYLTGAKSRGISRLISRELMGELNQKAKWTIDHRIGVSITFIKYITTQYP